MMTNKAKGGVIRWFVRKWRSADRRFDTALQIVVGICACFGGLGLFLLLVGLIAWSAGEEVYLSVVIVGGCMALSSLLLLLGMVALLGKISQVMDEEGYR